MKICIYSQRHPENYCTNSTVTCYSCIACRIHTNTTEYAEKYKVCPEGMQLHNMKKRYLLKYIQEYTRNTVYRITTPQYPSK